jgi:uncharacterized protein YqgV (UPF0045/DUF77 family)
MWHTETIFAVKLGGNVYINCEHLVECKGTSLFTIKRRDSDGLIGIDFDIHDPCGNRVATVRRGTIVDGDIAKYDLIHESHHYRVIEKESNRVICDIRRRENVRGVELDVSVDLYTPSGFHFQATPMGTNIGGNLITGCTLKDCRTGIRVD